MSLQARASRRQRYREEQVLSVAMSEKKEKWSAIRTAGEVSTNSGEVEWRDSEDKALERAVLDAANVDFGLEPCDYTGTRKDAHFHAPPEFFGGCCEYSSSTYFTPKRKKSAS